MLNNYRICTNCIMDTSDPEITFDKEGICNHCKLYDRNSKYLFSEKELEKEVEKIKQNGKGKKYDCIIGVSGGVDSTMVAYLTKKFGLRPLAVHLDNGWDSELAVSNIEKILKKLDIDLYTYVLDWEEFKDLQLSFLKASVANAEIPTDHAIAAVLYNTAINKGVNYIITGGNIVTEGIIPESWGYHARDLKHLEAVHRRFGKTKLKDFPKLGLIKWAYGTFIKKIKVIPILNYVPYIKKDAKEFIQKEIGWRDYGLKHYESIYTRFFQGYILPRKFGFDKRRAHLSSLINSGQITREEALKEMEKNPYPSEELLKEDKEYVIKKLGLTEKEFEDIMAQKVKSYKDYPNDDWFFYNHNLFAFFKKKVTHNY